MTSVSMLGRLNGDTAALRQKLDTLTQQVSTGRKTDRIGDLAPQRPQALDLQAEIGRRGA